MINLSSAKVSDGLKQPMQTVIVFGLKPKACGWTYTKTRGCVLVGDAPADDVRAICNIYDSGITFWKNGNEVGNYSLDNRA